MWPLHSEWLADILIKNNTMIISMHKQYTIMVAIACTHKPEFGGFIVGVAAGS